MSFHSEIFCTSFLVYAVRGGERLSPASRNIVLAIKEDGRIGYPKSMPAIAYTARDANLRRTAEGWSRERQSLHVPRSSQRILLVDDVVTRGATMLACYQRLRDAMPEVLIEGFAVARTQSSGEISAIVQPARQRCYLNGEHAFREE